MFIDYRFHRFLPALTVQYKIIDSEFEEIVQTEIGPLSAIIDVYEKRNLPMAPNLIKALICYSEKYNVNIHYIIALHKQNIPKFAKYEKELEKYLLLL
jgi:hypothetical protein